MADASAQGRPELLYAELYLHAHAPSNAVSLYRAGTHVLENIAELDAFARLPWTSGYVQGLVDAPYVNLTPGTRLGIIDDAALARLVDDLRPLEARLLRIIEDRQRAEEERATRDVLRSVQGALKEALLALPADEYDWFDLRRGDGTRRTRALADGSPGEPAEMAAEAVASDTAASTVASEPQRQFFEFAGPLFSLVISPTSSVVEVDGSRALRAVARDRARRTADQALTHAWRIVEGEGTFEGADAEIATFRAGHEPGLVRVECVVAQGDIVCRAEATSAGSSRRSSC